MENSKVNEEKESSEEATIISAKREIIELPIFEGSSNSTIE